MVAVNEKRRRNKYEISKIVYVSGDEWNDGAYAVGFIWRPNFDVEIEAGRGNNWKCWMPFETIDHSISVARQPLHDRLRIFVPYKEIPTITSTHHKFGIRTEKIHAFYCCHIPANGNGVCLFVFFLFHVKKCVTCGRCMNATLFPVLVLCCRTSKHCRRRMRPKSLFRENYKLHM